MESLSISNLTFHFEQKIIFKDFSLELPLRKFYALVGESGVGKSTFAHLVSGHLTPDSGEIRLGEKIITKPLRDIFIVHQEDDLFPWLTVLEQLKFVGATAEAIAVLLRIFKLTDSQNLYPHELSGGMKKRLALIRAELVGAKVLILDETLNSLNKSLLNEILEEMIPRWREQKMTVIFITHHLEDIRSYIDQVITF
jgi:ABC-type nitrate/sulfonate/bicarbonate transport system ATPase subunit